MTAPETSDSSGREDGEPTRAVERQAPAPAPPGFELRGTPVARGIVLGRLHRKDHDLARVRAQRVPLEGVERELNRFRRALAQSGDQLRDLKKRLAGRVEPQDARVLDTHLALLKDSVFIADVEHLILNEQLSLEAAIAKVIDDFDRIFRLVENEALRQGSADLRDVGVRVLRNLERERGPETAAPEPPPDGDLILVVRELSIVDMFDLANERVAGIVAEVGGRSGHAAIFARSLRIPAVVGVGGLGERVSGGETAILDATEGVLRVNPEPVVLEQFTESLTEAREPEATDVVPAQPRTLDGERIRVRASAGTLPEVDQAARLGMSGVGIYRTELLYVLGKESLPSVDALARHYRSVVERAPRGGVTFRLLAADSSLDLGALHPEREPNPSLGRAGVRLLLARPDVLRSQLRALLAATAGGELSVAIPFVVDCGELRRVRAILGEERAAAEREGEEVAESVEVGAVLETPASLLGVRELARESDFLLANVTAVVQYLLAADRESAELGGWFERLHPFVLRALAKVARVADELSVPLAAFGTSGLPPANLALVIGAGFREFCAPPSATRELLAELGRIDARRARESVAELAARDAGGEEAGGVRDWHHGFAPAEP